MGYETGIFVGPRSGGSIPPGPPTPVRLGNTLIVSAVGSDVNGARQDVVYHYATINAALNDYQAGDVIVVYPGQYDESITPAISCRIHFMSGATLTNAGVAVFIGSEEIELVITGDGNIVSTDLGYSVVLLAGSLYLECNSILCVDGVGVGLSDGESTIIVKDQLVTTGNGTCVDIVDGKHSLFLNYCGDLVEDDSRTIDNGFSNAAINVSNSERSIVQISAKTIRIRALGITVINEGAREFYLTADRILNESLLDPGDPFGHAVVLSRFRNDNTSVIRADIFASEFVTGYLTFDDGANPQSNPAAKHFYYGNVVSQFSYAALICGQIEGHLFLNGSFTNSTNELPVINVGHSDATFLMLFLVVQITGRVEAKSNTSTVIFQNTQNTSNPNIKIILDAIVINSDENAFSIQTDNAGHEPVSIYRLISNVPSDPDTVNEIISQSVVDPLVI